ncbi:MAG: C13 family peptidase [Phenylobacterium sp.]|uniref:C13 family peptidase n=1 Tax=Phenylobacterium sp. TaxID=1871053 RepID=UPI002715EF09|nr:C13 family peptidase [Phenylobacterium sp.]MDO8902235.1 C13 family peptidase [Phenylobacterium sp.]
MARQRAGLRFRICALALGLACGMTWPAVALAEPFQSWVAVVVAGDDKGSLGGPTKAFDNARRDISRAIIGLGLDDSQVAQFSVRPEGDRGQRPQKASARAIYQSLSTLAPAARGCLVYFTSHGDPRGVLVDDQILAPQILGLMLDRSCGEKPTVVVISACFSGVFVPALAKPNRMILTAARPDRTSFGCGEADTYPYFDACFLSAIDQVADFIALSRAVGACVAEREKTEGVSPPSEPQVWIGPQLRALLPLLTFAGARQAETLRLGGPVAAP